ncbi:MAG: N-acetylmuramoyl-L-alanine amidase [Bryobacterales bacterium]|nr:N-acetylmuramoyl-L-alanine amidase [Bryobacterales bacterium]MBV9396700.1 N-acetylmuramoyl-L-alanine amidase [Bryobacterales bacterium]
MSTYPHGKLDLLPLDHSAEGSVARNLVVLHVTAGPTAQSATATFKASVAPHRVSAHFCIDRDGTVYQLVDTGRTAWHASQVNARSIAIEHAAIPQKLPVTDAQYAASAALVAWFCAELQIPCDSEHVMGHDRASPQDRHVGCCEPTLSVAKVIGAAQVGGAGASAMAD